VATRNHVTTLRAAQMLEAGPGGLNAHVDKAIRTLRRYGVLGYHTHRSDLSQAGWPDWAIVGPGGFMVRELKRQTERPTAAQRAWLDALAAQGVNVGVWLPSDWFDGRIAEELATLVLGLTPARRQMLVATLRSIAVGR
jgi:hypothetical protein